MFQPLSLTLRNFQSYGNNVTKINLNFKSATLIQGRNMDAICDGMVDSNGAGKSSLLNAISYVCYDRVLNSKVKMNDLINRLNGKNLHVTFEFMKDNLFYRIERYRKLDKKGTGIIFLCKFIEDEEWNYSSRQEGGHDITNDSTANVDQAIEKIIGIPYEIFSRIITITASNTPFLDLKLEEQRNIVEELFGYTELTEKAERLKELIKTNNIEIDTLVKLDEQIKQELDRYNTQLSQAKAKVIEWEKSKDAKVKALETKIKDWKDTYGGVDFETEEKKFVTIQTLEQDIVKESAKITALSKDIATIETTITKIKAWNATYAKDVANLKAKCDQPLIFKSVKETQAFDQAIKEYDEKMATVNTIVIELDTKITKENNTLQSLKKDIKIKQDTISRLEVNLVKEELDIQHLKDSKCPFCEQQYEASKDKIKESEDRRQKIQNNINVERDNKLVELKLESELRIVELTKEKIKRTDERKAIQSEKQSFMVDILGSADINLQTEYNKTINHQTLLNQYELKVKETNPHLSDITLEDLEESKKELQDELMNWQSVIDDYNAKKKAILASLIFKQFKDIAPAKFTVDTLSTDLSKAEAEVNPHLDNLEQIESSVLPERKTDLIQTIHDTLEHEDFLLKLLTKKDSFIRKALLNKYLPFLNTRIKYYLDKIGLTHKVEFLDNMETKISQFKTEISFNTFSSGQKARVNLALGFAFRDVLSSRFGNIPFILLDECLDVGLGQTGVTLAIKMLKQICKENNLSMFIITHRDEVANLFSSKLVVELRNGYSSIVESDI